MNREALSPHQAVAHLQPSVWLEVNRRTVAKALAEFAHERLIAPQFTHRDAAWEHYLLATDRDAVQYRFRAQRLGLDHWFIDAPSIAKFIDGAPSPLDALALIIELRITLAISESVLPGYLEELASSLSGAAYKQVHPSPRAAELVHADFQTIESAMSAGHPCFVANNGRIGFSASDHRAYAPEVAQPIRLIWLAARKARADFACVNDLSYAQLMEQELGPALEAFTRALHVRGLVPADYLFIPVHPWQWQNRLVQLYAADLACGDLVYLGEGEDEYQAQQSIRTLFNVARPDRRYVKTALSILNMGFMRGLSPAIAKSAAAVNDWVDELVRRDAYLADTGFGVLREVAFTGFRHRQYERATTQRVDAYKEMLGALWRENPTHRVRAGQQLMTMAALMHRDHEGESLLVALIKASGLNVDAWLRSYLRAYLTPLVHCFYEHHLVFTPHCENVILVLENHVPVRVLVKDLAEDIGVLNPERPLPEAVKRLALRVPEELMTLSIFTDVFDCVFRFLAQLLYEHASYPDQKFWRTVADCIHDYERERPNLAEKFRRYDLFAPTFLRNCLNRLQLGNNRQMVDLNAADPVDSLQFAGTLDNPIAPFRAQRTLHDRQESHGSV